MHGAKWRGIGWELTFDQWLEFWGADLDRRGNGTDSLQMQRFADSGPYAVGNIRKGRPQQNVKTASAVRKNKASARAAAEHQKRLDAMMFAPSAPDPEFDLAGDDENTGNRHGNRVTTSFPRSWHFALATGKGDA